MKKHQENMDWHEMKVWEYRLLANPDHVNLEKLMAEKKYFESKYEAEIATKTLPYITIANFPAKEILEDRIGRLLQNICNQQYSFKVELNNFSGLPTKEIFIRVQNPQTFKRLTNRLQTLNEMLQANDCSPLQLKEKLCVPIASQLDEDIYNTAIKEYAAREFYEQITIDKLVLLKRDSRYKKWQHVNYFYLPPEKNLFN